MSSKAETVTTGNVLGAVGSNGAAQLPLPPRRNRFTKTFVGDATFLSSVSVDDAVTHGRFNLHASVHVEAHDDLGRERLCRYLNRSAFSLARPRVRREPERPSRIASEVSGHRGPPVSCGLPIAGVTIAGLR